MSRPPFHVRCVVPYPLHPDVYVADMGDTFVLLDLRSKLSEDYYALSPELSLALKRLARGSVVNKDEMAPIEQWLAPEALASTRSNTFQIAPAQADQASLTPPTVSCLEMRLSAPTLFDVLQAVFARLSADVAWSGRSMRDGIRRLKWRRSRKKPINGGTARTRCEQSVAAMQATGMLVKTHDRCVPRSLALAHRLISEGISPTFVIGVRTNPFEAHAWLQLDEIVLNDTVDQVGKFTPILVV